MEDICGDNSLKDDSNEVGVVDEVPHADPDPDQEEFEKVNAQREADKIELNIKQNSGVKKALKDCLMKYELIYIQYIWQLTNFIIEKSKRKGKNII